MDARDLLTRVSDGSSIEWTDATWNPVRGCSKISPGCKHCYAETFAERWRGIPGHPYESGFDLRLVPEKLAEPLSWSRSRKVFVNSMSDLFHADVPQAYIRLVFESMRLADWHVFQVLTKRADRLQSFSQMLPRSFGEFEHIWLGVSVEDRKYGVPRIEQLRRTRAKIRFLSIEPLLEDLGELDLHGIDWVIVGGESGVGARPLEPAWVRAIHRQCRRQGVPFFFKQWGGIRKKLAGRELDGRTYDAYPDVALALPPARSERRHRVEQMVDLAKAFTMQLDRVA